MKNNLIATFSVIYFCSTCFPIFAQENKDQTNFLSIEEVLVIGDKAAAQKVPGSGPLIDNDEMEKFDHVDLGQLLTFVPGLYYREEDGFGLRPNIGIRGAAGDRSQKITIMEDGVLITPAPYAAPAAYYIPNVSRIDSIEVLKGPAAIQHGPHTVGGAINFVTRAIPDAQFAEIDLSAGSDEFYKVQGAIGDSNEEFGYLIDGLAYGSDGFKEIDGGGDTGFDRYDIGAKVRWTPDTDAAQVFLLKLSYGEEDADETYLGLTDADFDLSPERRYPASQLAKFKSDHTKVHLNYGIQLSDSTDINVKLYRNEFNRSWNKLDGFILGPPLQNVLRSPSQFLTQYQILSGSRNSQPLDDELLEVTDNDRSFESTGVQWSLSHQAKLGMFDIDTNVGIRYHKDEVERDHQPISYLMVDKKLVPDGVARESKTLNKAQSEAYAAYLSSALEYKDIIITAGVRYENIEGEIIDKKTNLEKKSSEEVFTPGLGVFWQATEHLGFLAGVYKGFSPPGPGSDVESEETLNFEYGFRFEKDNIRLDVVGFFSDYDNLIGRCRVSDSDCLPGDEFNGGEVEVSGAEVTGGLVWALNNSLSLMADFTYTYTDASFETAFFSGFSQWGLVQKGDAVPYIPEHSGQLRLGLAASNWGLDATVKMREQTREVPGAGSVVSDLHSDGYAILDLGANYQLNERTRLGLVVHNVTDEAAIVSHRPFGARPNRPRSVVGRIVYRF